MGEFNLMSFEADAPGLRDAARLLQHDIRRYLAEGTVEGRAAAVNEFIAWGLSNQNLIDVMRKTKTRSRLGELALRVTKFLKQLLGLPEKTSLDMFSNLRLNAGSLLVDGRSWASDNRAPRSSRILNQLSRLPSDPRIEELMESFNAKIADHLRDRDVTWRDTEELSINRIADEAVNLVAGAGFSLDPQQVSAFRSVQAALASSMELSQGALTRIQRLFAHVTKQLSVESFMVEPESDRDPWDRQQAQEKFDLVTGKYGTRNDLQGRSNLMATFLALSQVSPEFRRAIRDVELPKDAASVLSGSTDERLTNAAESLMNGLATTIAGDRNSRSMLESLDRLTLALAKIEEDDRSQIEKKTNSILVLASNVASNFLQLMTLGVPINPRRGGPRTISEEISRIRISRTLTFEGKAARSINLQVEGSIRLWRHRCTRPYGLASSDECYVLVSAAGAAPVPIARLPG